MTTVVEVPGVGEVEFPDSMSEAQIAAALKQMKPPAPIAPDGAAQPFTQQQLIPGIGPSVSTVGQSPEASFIAPMTRAAVTRGADAVLGIPEAIHDFSPINVMTRSPEFLARQNLPIPTGQQAIAGIETGAQLVPGLLGGEPLNIQQRFQQNLEDAQRTAQENPLATFTGNLLGDAATIATGRLPFARTRGLQFLREGAKPQLFFGTAASSLKPSRLRALDRFVAGPQMTKLARGSGRALEAGFEGAALAVLHGGDPLETAAWTAGGQTLGSLLISGTSGRGGLKPLAVRAASLAAMIQLGKSFIPGGRDRSLESFEESIDSIKWAMILGAAGRVAGSGRKSADFTTLDRTLPGVAEAVNSLHRGAVISAVEQATNDQLVERTLLHLAANPDNFTKSQLQKLNSAIDAGTLDEAVNELMDSSRDFARLIDSTPIPGMPAGLLPKEDDDE